MGETLDLPFKGSVEKGNESLVSPDDDELGSGGDGQPPSLDPAVLQSTTQHNAVDPMDGSETRGSGMLASSTTMHKGRENVDACDTC